MKKNTLLVLIALLSVSFFLGFVSAAPGVSYCANPAACANQQGTTLALDDEYEEPELESIEEEEPEDEKSLFQDSYTEAEVLEALSMKADPKDDSSKHGGSNNNKNQVQTPLYVVAEPIPPGGGAASYNSTKYCFSSCEYYRTNSGNSKTWNSGQVCYGCSLPFIVYPKPSTGCYVFPRDFGVLGDSKIKQIYNMCKTVAGCKYCMSSSSLNSTNVQVFSQISRVVKNNPTAPKSSGILLPNTNSAPSTIKNYTVFTALPAEPKLLMSDLSLEDLIAARDIVEKLRLSIEQWRYEYESLISEIAKRVELDNGKISSEFTNARSQVRAFKQKIRSTFVTKAQNLLKQPGNNADFVVKAKALLASLDQAIRNIKSSEHDSEARWWRKKVNMQDKEDKCKQRSSELLGMVEDQRSKLNADKITFPQAYENLLIALQNYFDQTDKCNEIAEKYSSRVDAVSPIAEKFEKLTLPSASNRDSVKNKEVERAKSDLQHKIDRITDDNKETSNEDDEDHKTFKGHCEKTKKKLEEVLDKIQKDRNERDHQWH